MGLRRTDIWLVHSIKARVNDETETRLLRRLVSYIKYAGYLDFLQIQLHHWQLHDMSITRSYDPRSGLRAEVLSLVRPYANAEKNHIPFKISELIIMALAGSPDPYLEKWQIIHWIVQHF